MKIHARKAAELLLLAVFAVSVSLMSVQCASTDSPGACVVLDG